jgi:hypothetical protein
MVKTEQLFAINITVWIQPTARTKSSREKLKNCYFALASIYVSARSGLLLALQPSLPEVRGRNHIFISAGVTHSVPRIADM